LVLVLVVVVVVVEVVLVMKQEAAGVRGGSGRDLHRRLYPCRSAGTDYDGFAV
jgi:hypothetical protein